MIGIWGSLELFFVVVRALRLLHWAIAVFGCIEYR